MAERIAAPVVSIYSLLYETLVVCPQCEGCARSAPIDGSTQARQSLFAPRRLVCSKCGHWCDWSADRLDRPWHVVPGEDDFFRLPLWLQTSCCGQTLWFYNREHLELVERYVTASLRERDATPGLKKQQCPESTPPLDEES